VLAHFQDSISGFLPTVLVQEAVERGALERAPDTARFTYHAAIDPAFRRDAFAFTIVHKENGMVVQDVVRRWMAGPGEALTPVMVIEALRPVLEAYGVRMVYSDQYHLESLSQLFRDYAKIEIVGVVFTARSKAQLYGNLQQLFLQKRIRLLDDYETVRELKSLERTVAQGGSVQIGAPPGLHDDLASVVCLASAQTMWDHERVGGEPEAKDDSIHQRCMAQVQRKWEGRREVNEWD
jgi:hypothetical protein